MNKELSSFAARLREIILSEGRVTRGSDLEIRNGYLCNSPFRQFDSLALELFALQFKYNAAYRKICEARGVTPEAVEHWTQIPAVPTMAFKELELTSLAPDKRTTVFHSSGTTEQKPSRHFHNADSLSVYEVSSWSQFCANVLPDLKSETSNFNLAILTPPPPQAPHSSLVHMFETVRRKLNFDGLAFVGETRDDNSWALDFDRALKKLHDSADLNQPLILLGTAFSFVHLLDFLAEENLRFQLPGNSRVMETGGYKNRSRTLPGTELHALVTERLGVPRENIVREYGMSELSSQAYDPEFKNLERHFHFPPWARAQIISPETGHEVCGGETGLVRVFDLANVFSVASIQTEDLGIRRGDGFELIGRVQLAEPRGCSLMTA